LAVLSAGCASSSAIGVANTTANGGGGGFNITANSGMGFRIGDNFELGLTSNMSFGNWRRAGNAYSKLNEWAGDGAVECCGGTGPLITIFKYMGLGMGYLTAWMLATNELMTGPRLRWYVNQYAPTLYLDLGAGPAAFFDEDGANGYFGLGGTAAVGYMFNPYIGLELRTTMGNVNDPQWATIGIGLVVKPKKRVFGLFGKNDLEKPAEPPPPPRDMSPLTLPPQPMPPPPTPAQPMPQQPAPMPPPEPSQPSGPPGTTAPTP